ncbi:hypothetical protein [Streptomyces sp. NPDC021224]|uniref:hypothetical protein n=1 Tax=unclassified Streptomyces TaxID=2593676 RepID=UPI0037A9323A
MPDPIEPTAVIPAGWPLPTRGGGGAALPPPPPPVPPAPYTPPPAPAPLPPRDVVVTVDPIRIDVTITTGPPPEPDPPTWADRLQARRNGICCFLAFLPATAWAGVLHTAWQQAGLSAAWVMAATAAATAAVYDQRRRGREPSTPTDRGRGNLLTRTALCAALLAPALGLPVVGSAAYLMTGVTP